MCGFSGWRPLIAEDRRSGPAEFRRSPQLVIGEGESLLKGAELAGQAEQLQASSKAQAQGGPHHGAASARGFSGRRGMSIRSRRACRER